MGGWEGMGGASCLCVCGGGQCFSNNIDIKYVLYIIMKGRPCSVRM